jgi:hypothetical protein
MIMAKKKELKKYRMAPLSGGYMAVSMMGFMISALLIIPKSDAWGINKGWGVAFALVFGTMFFASMASMTNADPELFVELETKKNKEPKRTLWEVIKSFFN